MTCGFAGCRYRSGCQSSMNRHRKLHAWKAGVRSERQGTQHAATPVLDGRPTATESASSSSRAISLAANKTLSPSSSYDHPPSHHTGQPKITTMTVRATISSQEHSRPELLSAKFRQSESVADHPDTEHAMEDLPVETQLLETDGDPFDWSWLDSFPYI